MKPIESVVRFRSLTTPSKRLTVQNEGRRSGAGEGNRTLCTLISQKNLRDPILRMFSLCLSDFGMWEIH
jgi:hypothetical protein